MHSYRHNTALTEAQWEVFFDCGADTSHPQTLKTYRYEVDAVRLVNALNGGEIGSAVLQVLLERGS